MYTDVSYTFENVSGYYVSTIKIRELGFDEA